MMKRFLYVTFLLLISVALHPLHAEDGFRSLFNGKDLSGWDGNPELWSVEDGVIVGKTIGPEQLAYNQFLIWRDGTVQNFELRAMVKQSGNNSGIQYRSRELPEVGKWSVGGYQCDIHPAAPNNSMVYGEKAGGILVQNGQNIVIDPDGKAWLVSKSDPIEADVAQWHEYTIIAQGNHIVHKIDGKTTIELRDFDEKARDREGLLAFQIHRGPAMSVHIKDVMIKVLPEGGFVAFDKNALPEGTVALGTEKPKGKAKAKGKSPTKGKTPAK
jgi:hypothetical protein